MAANDQIALGSATFAGGADSGAAEHIDVPLPTPEQRSSLGRYAVAIVNPTQLGTAVSVVFENSVDFRPQGLGAVLHSQVTSVQVDSGQTQTVVVEGWLLGPEDARIRVMLSAAASATGGIVRVEVRAT